MKKQDGNQTPPREWLTPAPKTEGQFCLCRACCEKRAGNERFDTLIVGFNNTNNTTRTEIQSALDTDPAFKADPLKLPWAYYELALADQLYLLIPLVRLASRAGCLHLHHLIEPEFGARLAPVFMEPARLQCVTREGALSDLLFQHKLSRKLNPDFYFERAQRAQREPTEHERAQREREREFEREYDSPEGRARIDRELELFSHALRASRAS
jgi:hypothetical protein